MLVLVFHSVEIAKAVLSGALLFGTVRGQDVLCALKSILILVVHKKTGSAAGLLKSARQGRVCESERSRKRHAFDFFGLDKKDALKRLRSDFVWRRGIWTPPVLTISGSIRE